MWGASPKHAGSDLKDNSRNTERNIGQANKTNQQYHWKRIGEKPAESFQRSHRYGQSGRKQGLGEEQDFVRLGGVSTNNLE